MRSNRVESPYLQCALSYHHTDLFQQTTVYGAQSCCRLWPLADRVGLNPISRIKNNDPMLVIPLVFRYTKKRYGDVGAEARTKATVFESQSSNGALQRVRQGAKRSRDRECVPSNQSLIQSCAWHTLFTEATKAYWTTGTVLTHHEQPTTITTGQGLCQCMRGAYSTHTTPLRTILER